MKMNIIQFSSIQFFNNNNNNNNNNNSKLTNSMS
jgi:hypothetical protein